MATVSQWNSSKQWTRGCGLRRKRWKIKFPFHFQTNTIHVQDNAWIHIYKPLQSESSILKFEKYGYSLYNKDFSMWVEIKKIFTKHIQLFFCTTNIHTYVIYTHNSIYEVGVFFRIMTAHISSVLTLCPIKNTLYKPNAIQTRRFPLIIMYAVHLPATKQNTTFSSGQWHVKRSNYNRNKGLQKTHTLSTVVTKIRHRILMTMWQWH
jgi:hypothetical protein